MMIRPTYNLQAVTQQIAIVLYFACIIASPSNAQSSEMDSHVKEGQSLAKELCSKCHAIDKEDVSKNSKAPPFRTFSKKWPLENLEEALAEGIVVGHDDMPEFKFNPKQIASFIAYLEKLNPAPKPQK